MKTILAISILMFALTAQSQTGTQSCNEKKSYLRDICTQQVLKGNTANFSKCANGFSYEISTDKKDIDTSLISSQVSCKVVEIRNIDGIEQRISYYDDFDNKAVVYKHNDGLSYSYVYGQTGYYHITELASGDSIYNFYSFEN